MTSQWDTIIVGAGASGLAAAGACTGRTLVLERKDSAGRKLLITGGNRCNITHETDPDGIMAAFGRDGRFMRQALYACGPADIRAMLADNGVPTTVDCEGCVFPASQKAADVLAAMMRMAKASGAEFRFRAKASRLIIEDGSVVGVASGEDTYLGRRVILAAGGKSYPGTGSDGSGFELAAGVGLSIVTPVPAVAGLHLDAAWLAELAGMCIKNARVWLPGKGRAKHGYTGQVLFTHQGISGPPVLALSGDVSARLSAGQKPVAIQLSVDADRSESDWLTELDGWRAGSGARKLSSLLAERLTRRSALLFCRQLGISSETPCSQLRKDDGVRLARFLAGMPLQVKGTDGWDRAMVTRGGVALKEIDPSTMRCRNVPGLYCVGELLDLDGICGGYNLTWAIASGRLAAMS